ncbi:MAG: MerR family transcriptional regulator [Acidobacteriaceae bacterium]
MGTVLTRGQLAHRATVNPATIRYYERKGLLPKARRSPAGYRIYPESMIRKLRLIKRVHALGFTLTEIAELLALQATPERACSSVCGQIQDKIANIERRIIDLRSIQRALGRMAQNCTGDRTVRECGVLEVLADD